MSRCSLYAHARRGGLFGVFQSGCKRRKDVGKQRRYVGDSWGSDHTCGGCEVLCANKKQPCARWCWHIAQWWMPSD